MNDNEQMDALTEATKFIKSAYKIAGDDIGLLKKNDFRRMCAYLRQAIYLINSNTEEEIDKFIVPKEYIIEIFDKHYPQWRKRDRYKMSVASRYTLIYTMRKFTKESTKFIGKLVGNFDHTTVVHAEKKVKNLLSAKDPLLTQIYSKVINELSKFCGDEAIIEEEENYEELSQKNKLLEVV